MQAVLFDLDGTLLPLDMDEFIHGYFSLLAKKAMNYGYDREQVISGTWSGTEAMLHNDGSMTNKERFFRTFASVFGEKVYQDIPVFDRFYEEEFQKAVMFTQPNPKKAQEAVKRARAIADKVILATNPLFPRGGVETRLQWLGLSCADFDYVSSYENSTYCKPNPKYYEELLSVNGLNPAQCLMIGNDVEEDFLAAKEAGISCYLVKDCLLTHNKEVPAEQCGSFDEMLQFINGPDIYEQNLPDRFVSEAVFSDGTKEFCNPPESDPGDFVTISIRTAASNVGTVSLVMGETVVLMKRKKHDPLFDYFAAEIKTDERPIWYYFVLTRGQETYYYTRVGIVSKEQCQQFSFSVLPGFHTPEWAKGAVLYQIFVDRFCNGDVNNDVRTNEYYYLGGYSVRTETWDKNPAPLGVREFYGGDLAGILKRLDYLEELGIDAIYLNPIFVSPSNHKYDIQDYDYIDPHYGIILSERGECLPDGEQSNEKATLYKSRVTDLENLKASNHLFATLVKEVHKRGMKVILDGVFNHCGSSNKWLDREGVYRGVKGYQSGAYESKDSPYRSFFRFKEDSWPNNKSYDGWWGHHTLPKLYYEQSPQLEEYILKIAQKWLSPPYNVDGWRLDVAADLGYSSEYNHEFWKKFRKVVKECNPEALILAEHYGDPFDWLQGDQWDSVMNYDAFMEPVTWFFTGMEKHSDEYNGGLLSNPDSFRKAMNYHMSRFPMPSLQVAMNELSNHDHSRFLTRTNRRIGRISTVGAQAANEGINRAVMREAVVMQFTWPGAPTIYYGDEAGVCGWSDPDNRRTYPWGREDSDMVRFHREIIRIHKGYPCLRQGSLILLCEEAGVIAYGRFDETDRFIIVFNNQNYEQEVEVPVWKAGLLEEVPIVRLLYSHQEGYSFEAKMYQLQLGIVKVQMKPFSAIILKNLPQQWD